MLVDKTVIGNSDLPKNSAQASQLFFEHWTKYKAHTRSSGLRHSYFPAFQMRMDHDGSRWMMSLEVLPVLATCHLCRITPHPLYLPVALWTSHLVVSELKTFGPKARAREGGCCDQTITYITSF